MVDGLYTDGGCCGRNPSSIGGTWAWCLVRGGEIVRNCSGIVTPKDMGIDVISNNNAELLAAVRGLSSLLAREPDWSGTLFTDSKVTLYRLTTSSCFEGVPNGLRLKTLEIRRNRRWSVELVGGHPSQEDLARGCRKSGLPVSPFNVWVDSRCSRLAKERLKEENGHTETPWRNKHA